MIAPAIARTAYVQPALNRLNMRTPDAEHLLMGTAAVESNFTNFVQFGGGPARGMFQMELATYDDIMNRYLALPAHRTLRQAVVGLAAQQPPSFLALTDDHLFAAGLARVKYAMIPAAIPTTLAAQATYWWVHYNGQSPHGLQPADYLARWNDYCHALYPTFT